MPPEQFIRVKMFAGLLAVIAVGVCCFFGVLIVRAHWRPPTKTESLVGLLLTACGGVGALVFAYAFCIEPDWLEVTQHEIRTARLVLGSRLRIVQLSDLHVDDLTPALAELPDRVNALHPDVLIITGDLLNDADGLPLFRDVVSRLHAPGGKFVVRGNHDLDKAPVDLLRGWDVKELTGSPVTLGDGRITLCGAAFGEVGALEDCLRQTHTGYRMVAYHSPDLVEDLQNLAPDLYLAGHTHGGQMRLPGYGAIITNSVFDKRYDMGSYEVGSTTLYVNRGIGDDGGPIRARLLCRPEIAVFDIVGTGGGAMTAHLVPHAPLAH